MEIYQPHQAIKEEKHIFVQMANRIDHDLINEREDVTN